EAEGLDGRAAHDRRRAAARRAQRVRRCAGADLARARAAQPPPAAPAQAQARGDGARGPGRRAMTALWGVPAWSIEIDETQHVPLASEAPGASAPHAGAGSTIQAQALLGRFRVVGMLGTGGMGEVVLAEDTMLGRRVAIKRLRGELAAAPRQRARLRNE